MVGVYLNLESHWWIIVNEDSYAFIPLLYTRTSLQGPYFLPSVNICTRPPWDFHSFHPAGFLTRIALDIHLFSVCSIRRARSLLGLGWVIVIPGLLHR